MYRRVFSQTPKNSSASNFRVNIQQHSASSKLCAFDYLVWRRLEKKLSRKFQIVRICSPKSMSELDNVGQLPDNIDINNSPTKSFPLAPVLLDADCYNMEHKYRGKCIIFNHEKFDNGYEERKCSSIDANRIEKTFKKLGFTVEILNNLDYGQIIAALHKLSKDNHEDSDCICIFMLTHSTSNDIINAKNKEYMADEIWKPFIANRCTSLAGKPKLFFFSTSRVEKPKAERRHASRDETKHGQIDALPVFYTIPVHADFLFAHSFVGDSTEDSKFVEYLCQVLEKYADRKDLLTMMTMTLDKTASQDRFKKQVPSVTSMLVRNIYFTASSVN